MTGPVVTEGHLAAARAVVAEWRSPVVHTYKRAGSEGFLVGLIAAAMADAGVSGDVEGELLHLARVRALVAEHPADAVPVLELAAVARAAGVEVEG